MMLRRRGLALLVAVVALGAGACAKAPGGNTTNGTTHLSPFQLVSAAASKTAAAKTAHMSMSMTMSGGGLSQDLTMSGGGDLDIAHGAFAMTISMSGIPGHTGGFNIGMVMSHGAMYMQLPQNMGGAMLPAGKSWIKIDLAAIAKQSGMSLPGFGGGSMGAWDPTQQFAYLKGISKSVQDVGSETLAGTPVEHYRVAIDMKKALQKVSGPTACGLGAMEKVLGNTTFPADVWVDHQGRLRQMDMHMSMNVPGTGQSVSMDVKMGLFDFGTPVHVTVPPASEVYDITGNVPTSGASGCRTTTT